MVAPGVAIDARFSKSPLTALPVHGLLLCAATASKSILHGEHEHQTSLEARSNIWHVSATE